MRFDKKTYRKGTGCLKWDENPNIEYPLWVADMDFQTAPEIFEALQKRLNNGIFGYTYLPDEWHKAYQSWWRKRHNLKIDKDSLIFFVK